MSISTDATANQLRVLVVHNKYQQRGGEDTVVEAELELLRSRGHAVAEYIRTNDDIKSQRAINVASQTFWSLQTQKQFGALAQDFKPDVVHVHNTFPLISPSVFWAANRLGLPIVQTLHNFRLICPQGLLLRDGKVCDDCVGHIPWRAAKHACYRDSRAQSTVLAAMVASHRAIGTWENKVTRYIALNAFCREQFIAGGIPAAKISIKPNFVDVSTSEQGVRTGFLFVGRLSKEKGVHVLAHACKELARTPVTVRIAGSGPAANELSNIAGLQELGALNAEQVLLEMRSASALVLPSIWYENFPRTIVEAFACGLPVIASNIGALPSLVQDGVTGILFKPGNPQSLAEKLAWAEAHPEAMRTMGHNARCHYERELTGSVNYPQLIDIYQTAIKDKQLEKSGQIHT